MDYGGFSVEDATEIYRRVMGGGSVQTEHRKPDNVETQGRYYWVVMTETMVTATNPFDGYSQAGGRILRYLLPRSDTLDREATTSDNDIITITNRDIALWALVGDVILVVRNGSEWNPITQPGPFWAVNVGDFDEATHPLTGAVYGTAALLRYVDSSINDDLVVTNIRTPYLRRDKGGTIDDGTLIMLDVVGSRLTLVWSDCSAVEEFEDIEPAPVGGTTLGGNGRVWE